MSETFLLFVLGIALLLFGADWLVAGATRIARSMNISPLVIGLTVVAFGTSLPEAAVTVSAALDGVTDVALGNIVGSNIFNVLLILGIAAAIAPLFVSVQLLRQEVPIMIGTSLLLAGLIADGLLSRSEGLFLLSLAVTYTVFLIVQARRSGAKLEEIQPELPAPGRLDRLPAPIVVVIGLVMLVTGGSWLVESATTMARSLGISELVIGLTVVAVGTSLPEVATCVSAVLRGERDLAVGNVVGSNIFNILFCLGLSSLVSPTGLPAPAPLLHFDLWIMVATAAVTFPIILTGRKVSHWEGWLLLVYCVAYIAYTLLAATEHDALPAFSYTMMIFVIPITAIAILASLLRQTR